MHDPLLHRKPLLVVAAGDAENITFEFWADRISGNFLAHAAVHEDAELALIINFDKLLGAIGGVGDVELHLDADEPSSRCCCAQVRVGVRGHLAWCVWKLSEGLTPKPFGGLGRAQTS